MSFAVIFESPIFISIYLTTGNFKEKCRIKYATLLSFEYRLYEAVLIRENSS